MPTDAPAYNARISLSSPACGRSARRVRQSGRPGIDWKRFVLAGAIAATLAAAPFADADARRRGPWVWPFVAGAAVVGTAAAIATAPLRAWCRRTIRTITGRRPITRRLITD